MSARHTTKIRIQQDKPLVLEPSDGPRVETPDDKR